MTRLIHVVEADQERTQPGSHDLPHRANPVLHAVKADRLEATVLGHREDLQRHVDDDTEGPFGADEQLLHVRADRGPRDERLSTTSPEASTTVNATTRSSMLP